MTSSALASATLKALAVLGEEAEPVAAVLKPRGDDMDDVLMALDAAMHHDEPRAHHHLPLALEHLGPDHRIGDSRLVLDGHEHHALRRAGALTHEHDAGDAHPRPVAHGFEIGASSEARGSYAVAEEAHRMSFEGKPERAVVVHHMLGEGHDWQRDERLAAGIAGIGVFEQRQRQFLRQTAHLPKRLAAVEPERAEGIGCGELLQACALQPAPPPQIAHVAVSLGGNGVAYRDKALHVVLAQPVDLAHAEAEREGVFCLRYRASRYLSAGRFERAVPEAEIDVGLARLDAVIACAAHDLRRRVEAHRLRVEQRRGKRRRVMAFDPGRDIDEMGEARGVALGEAIFAEALDLIEAALGELGRIAARRHAAHHLLVQSVDGAAAAEGRHGAAQLVGLGAGEFRRHHGEPHGLLLE